MKTIQESSSELGTRKSENDKPSPPLYWAYNWKPESSSRNTANPKQIRMKDLFIKTNLTRKILKNKKQTLRSV